MASKWSPRKDCCISTRTQSLIEMSGSGLSKPCLGRLIKGTQNQISRLEYLISKELKFNQERLLNLGFIQITSICRASRKKRNLPLKIQKRIMRMKKRKKHPYQNWMKPRKSSKSRKGRSQNWCKSRMEGLSWRRSRSIWIYCLIFEIRSRKKTYRNRRKTKRRKRKILHLEKVKGRNWIEILEGIFL